MENALWAIPATALVGLIGMVFHNNRSNDTKVNRVFERVDEVKTETEKKFVHIQVCEVLHRQIREDIKEVKHKLQRVVCPFCKGKIILGIETQFTKKNRAPATMADAKRYIRL